MGSAPTNTKKRINYEECAAYIAAIGEVKAAFGEPDAKQKDISEYTARYPRHTAFKGALQSFG